MLAQAMPTTGTAAAGYTNKNHSGITAITVCNNSSAAITYSIYVDQGGSTYATSNAIFYQVSIDAKSTDLLEFAGNGLTLDHPSDTIGVQSSVGSAVTFSIFGTRE